MTNELLEAIKNEVLKCVDSKFLDEDFMYHTSKNRHWVRMLDIHIGKYVEDINTNLMKLEQRLSHNLYQLHLSETLNVEKRVESGIKAARSGIEAKMSEIIGDEFNNKFGAKYERLLQDAR